MAAKRGATSDLNHENWDQEEEAEEAGTFVRASDEKLKRRVIKLAKRRNPIRQEDEQEGGHKSAFSSFTGFSSKPPSSDYSFLKNIAESDDTATKTNGINSGQKDSPSINIFSNPKSSIFGAPIVTQNNANNSTITSSSNKIVPSFTIGADGKSERYCSRLKGLNESVLKWISQKVTENPFISLQPIFKDYDKYLDDIEKEEKNTDTTVNKSPVPTFNFNPSKDKNSTAVPDSTSEKDKTGGATSFKFGSAAASSSVSTFTFGTPAQQTQGNSKAFPTFSSSTGTATIPTFSFGSANAAASSGGGTPFGSTGFQFSSNTKPVSDTPTKPNESEEADEDEPPKVSFTPVVENDHLFTIRCKAFVKKDDNFADRGVGNLYLKPIEKSEKVQLIVRADTNLGNLLLNFILSENVPTKRLGKKDVMLVAIPTPDEKPPPTPILLRVKSPEEADNLLTVLEKHKK